MIHNGRVPPRVLLVDDDISEIAAVKRVLREAGLQPVLATNASDAAAEVERARPALLLVAPCCENGEGAALARRLAAEAGTRDVPLLLLGEGGEDVPAPSLPRPLDAADLRREIAAALERAPACPAPTAAAPADEPARMAPWGDGEALQLAAEAEALRQRAENEARRAEVAEENRRREELESDLRGKPEADRRAQGDRQPVPAASAIPGEVTPPLPAEMLEGTTGATPMPRLLAIAARARATGRLEVATKPPRALWFEEGRIVGAASAAPGERTEAIALSAGLVTSEQHRAIGLAAGERGPRSVAVLLVERGFLNASELRGLMLRRAEEVAFELFSGDAPFRFTAAQPVPAEERASPDRGTLALAVEGARRRWDASRLDAILGGPASLLAPGDCPAPLGDLGLSPGEARAVSLADGLRSVEEISVEAELDLRSARPALAALVAMGALEVRVRGTVGPAPARAASIDSARLAEKAEQVRHADYFTVLGLRREATRYEIGEAADRLLAEFSSERVGDLVAAGTGTPFPDIRQVLEDARDVLLDDELRAAYLAATSDNEDEPPARARRAPPA